MASKKQDCELIKLKSIDSTYIYYTVKNKKKTTQKLELMKYCPISRKRVLFKEAGKAK